LVQAAVEEVSVPNLLRNPGFEVPWGEQRSHKVAILRPGEDAEIAVRGSVFTPPYWLTWFVHVPGTWDQPEVREAHLSGDPRRVCSGERAMALFSFHRRHDAGFLQFIATQPGQRIRATAWAHAWSNHTMASGRPDDPRWSDGAGKAIVAWPAGSCPGNTGDEQEDAKPNMTFSVGIDPTGHGDPRAPSVVWGPGFHVYNGYAQQLEVAALAQGEVATVFLRGVTLWAFKHNDNYWDDCEAQIVEELPRQYHRVYALLPAELSLETSARIFAKHQKEKQTVGYSADDAFAREPRLLTNTVIAYDAATAYPGGRDGLRQFARTYYREPDRWVWPQSGDAQSLLLWQQDERWKAVRLGDPGCALTIGQAGCFVTCLAMAQRHYGQDPEATPATVNRQLQGGGFAAGAPCRPLFAEVSEWLEIELVDGWRAEAKAHLDAGGCVLAEVKPASYEHYVLLMREEGGRFWMLDPLLNIEGWLDTQYEGVERWLLARKADPPPPPLPGMLNATLHLQTMSHSWEQYVAHAKPAACKVLASLQDALGVRRANPGTFPIVRLYDPHEFNFCFGYPNTRAGQRAGARAFIRRYEDSMHDVADQLEREHPGLEAPYYGIECLNEGYATGGPHTAQILLFEEAFADLTREIEPRVAPVPFCAAVGNPGEWEFEQLIPLARATERANGFLGYHGYWFANPDETGMTAEHQPYLHGRWMEIDKVLVRAGITARWFLGESGAVGGRLISDAAEVRALVGEPARVCAGEAGRLLRSPAERVEPLRPWAYGYRPEVFYVPLAAPPGEGEGGLGGGYKLLPHDGYLSPECYGGDLDRYIADACTFEALIDAWNLKHGSRCWGFAFFTTGEEYTGWPSFQFRWREMQALMAALR